MPDSAILFLSLLSPFLRRKELTQLQIHLLRSTGDFHTPKSNCQSMDRALWGWGSGQQWPGMMLVWGSFLEEKSCSPPFHRPLILSCLPMKAKFEAYASESYWETQTLLQTVLLRVRGSWLPQPMHGISFPCILRLPWSIITKVH